MNIEVLPPIAATTPQPGQYLENGLINQSVLSRLEKARSGLPNTSSDRYSPRVFAFNLSRARQLALIHQMDYWPNFEQDCFYYLKETYGKVEEDKHRHQLKTNDEGWLELGYWRGQEWVSAKACYASIVSNPNYPLWSRQRAGKDVDWVKGIEQGINKDPEQTLVDLSPTEYSVPLSQRRECSFGAHSFARVSRLVEADGTWELETTNLRNYLDMPEQLQLFQTLTGEVATADSLLGQVRPLKAGWSTQSIKEKALELYAVTPELRRIEIPIEDRQIMPPEQVLAYHHRLINRLKGIYLLKTDAAIPNWMVQEEFRAWEMDQKSLISGQEIDTSYWENTSPLQIYLDFKLGSSKSDKSFGFYNPGGNACGLGAGFTTARLSKMPSVDNWVYEDVTCVGCNKKVSRAGYCKLCFACQQKIKHKEDLITKTYYVG